MSAPRLFLGVLVVALAVPTASPTGSSELLEGLPARVGDFSPDVQVRVYPSQLPDGSPGPDTTWRVVRGTGNCCENYLASTLEDRIVDFGGTYLNFTDDRGLTWSRVRPLQPFLGGEGAVSAAPGGDIVGVAWDVYSGDNLVAFKYEAAADRWLHMPNKLHTPLFDRPWLSVIQGPVRLAGAEVPYAVGVVGGSTSAEVLYLSGDGLTYTEVKSTALEAAISRHHPTTQPTADPVVDLIQPHTRSRISPWAGGGALVASGYPVCSWVRLLPNGSWSCASLPNWTGRVLVDGTGLLHHVEAKVRHVTHTVTDGASTVVGTVPLPAGFEVAQWDFKVHASLGVLAVAVHALNTNTDTHVDLVLRYSLDGLVANLELIQFLGQGDRFSGSGLRSVGPRFDFSTLTILPDGKLAASFTDSEFHPPSVAIEL